jgi:hypothetical protein
MRDMPSTMARLAVVQFFSWFALFAMWIYTTATVTSVYYGSTDTASAAYNTGANWVGVLFAAYNGSPRAAIAFRGGARSACAGHLVNPCSADWACCRCCGSATRSGCCCRWSAWVSRGRRSCRFHMRCSPACRPRRWASTGIFTFIVIRSWSQPACSASY